MDRLTRLDSLSPTPPPEPPRADALSAVRAIFERYRGAIEDQIDRIEVATLALLEGHLEAETKRAAERDAHKLAGSLGTFGFAQGSKVAREIEYVLQGPSDLDQQDALRLSELVIALRDSLVERGERTVSWPPPAEDESPTGPTVLLVDADADLSQRLSMELAGRGFNGVVAADLEAARARLSFEEPTAVLLDIGIGPGPDGGLIFLNEITTRYEDLPVIVVTARDAFIDRVEVARRGGRGFIQKPQTPSAIAHALVDAIQSSERRGPTILAIDDDPMITGSLQALLQPQGMNVVTSNHPLTAWDLIAEHEPDLLILDIDMPELNGIEICRTLRNDARWAALPILFLSARADTASLTEGFGAGADDFVSKPLVPLEFLARITARLERAELMRSLTETDPLTRVATRTKAIEQMERLLNLARRHGQPVAVGAIAIDGLDAVNRNFGHAVGDKLLRRFGELIRKHLTGDDVVGRWAGKEFIAALYGMTRQDGVERVAALLDELREERLEAATDQPLRASFTAGVSAYPDDGSTIDALVGAAITALDTARSERRGRVLPVGWTPGESNVERTQVDVVIVEDDPPVAELLAHTLETRGISTMWLNDGGRAAEMLAAEPRQLICKVVLLDVDLPGLDGLSILQRLAQGGVLQGTRVIMLTVRAAEVEVLRAMELGAFDHVSKPFSTPVLMQRIRRAIDA